MPAPVHTGAGTHLRGVRGRVAELAAVVGGGHRTAVDAVAGGPVAVLHPVDEVVPGGRRLGGRELAVPGGPDRPLHELAAATLFRLRAGRIAAVVRYEDVDLARAAARG